jgi:uncharacterized protein (TIGR02145 family)
VRYATLVASACVLILLGCDRDDPLVPHDETVTDVDGNIYEIVRAGDQLWLAENLRTTRYRDGTSIATGLDATDWGNATSGAYAIYSHDLIDGLGSDDEVLTAYGALYNWYAVLDPRGLCPEGWHVPSDQDWKQLELRLGMSPAAADATGLRGPGIGGMLKAARTEPDPHPRWDTPNPGATDQTGWSGLPSGIRTFHGSFDFVGRAAYWWSSTAAAAVGSTSRAVFSSNDLVQREASDRSTGSSVRCLRPA